MTLKLQYGEIGILGIDKGHVLTTKKDPTCMQTDPISLLGYSYQYGNQKVLKTRREWKKVTKPACF